MRLFIINVLLLTLVTSSLGDGVRLGGRKEWPMAEEIEVDEVGVDTETVVPTSIIDPPDEETVVPTFMGSSSTSGETCCSCPDIPEGATEEEICLILEGMDEDCDSICEEDGGDGPNRQRNLQGWLDYISNQEVNARSLQFGCGSFYPPRMKPKIKNVKFENCDLSRVRRIPEDNGKGDNSMPPHPMPANDEWYYSDGLCFFNTMNFWKIPNHCSVFFDCNGKRLEVLPPDENGGWRFSVQPKVSCQRPQWCFFWLTHQTPWPKSVPTPQWHPNYDGNPGWPDCTNATNWVGGGGGGVPSF